MFIHAMYPFGNGQKAHIFLSRATTRSEYAPMVATADQGADWDVYVLELEEFMPITEKSSRLILRQLVLKHRDQ